MKGKNLLILVLIFFLLITIALGSIFILSSIENMGMKEVSISQSGSGIVGVTIVEPPKKESENLKKIET
ncbi:MAG: hypothetical protein ABIF40_03860 [archaeon]